MYSLFNHRKLSWLDLWGQMLFSKSLFEESRRIFEFLHFYKGDIKYQIQCMRIALKCKNSEMCQRIFLRYYDKDILDNYSKYQMLVIQMKNVLANPEPFRQFVAIQLLEKAREYIIRLPEDLLILHHELQEFIIDMSMEFGIQCNADMIKEYL